MSALQARLNTLEQDEQPFWTEEDLLAKAREYAQNGKAFLEVHIPNWLERAGKSTIFDMQTSDYCALAIACKGLTINGRSCYSAGDVGRAFPDQGLGKPEFGFYQAPEKAAPPVAGRVPTIRPPVKYKHLQVAWMEIFGRGIVLR